LPCAGHCCRAGGLLPHLFTLAKRSALWKTFRRFSLRTVTGLRFAGGMFSVALSVTAPASRPKPRQSTIPWRYQARRPKARNLAARATVSGLSSRPNRSGPAVTRPTRQGYYTRQEASRAPIPRIAPRQVAARISSVTSSEKEPPAKRADSARARAWSSDAGSRRWSLTNLARRSSPNSSPFEF